MDKSVPICLGVDYGLKRVGVAIVHANSTVSIPLATLLVKTDGETRQKLCDMAREHKVRKIVVGMPLNMNGTRGAMAVRVRGFARKLGDESGLRVETWDERLTTREAQSRLDGNDSNTDALAASIMLQSYVDAL